jgi:hypothetical protein
VQQAQRLVAAAGPLGRRQQPACRAVIAAIQRRLAGMDQFFRPAVPLGERAAGALDVRARLAMRAIEEQHPRPDVDGELVTAGKIVIEPDEQQFLYSRVAFATIGVPGGGAIEAQRVGHAERVVAGIDVV